METSCPLWIGKLPGISRDRMARAELYPHKDVRQLKRSLAAGPQFRRLKWQELLTWRSDQLRVVLIARQDYYAAQAAAHLTALERLLRPWPGEVCRGEEGSDRRDLSRHLTLLDAGMLCPGGDDSAPLRLSGLNTPAVLIRGDPLGEGAQSVLEQIEDTVPQPGVRPMHLFLALRPETIDPRRLADLELRYGFQVGVVDEPDLPYLGRQLRAMTRELLPVQDGVDWEALVRRVQEIRGEDFVETDLACIPARALMCGTSVPASREDLMPKLFNLSEI